MNSNSLGSIDLCFLLSHKMEFGISVTSFDISALSVVKGFSNRVQKVSTESQISGPKTSLCLGNF